jgi:plastocyanin
VTSTSNLFAGSPASPLPFLVFTMNKILLSIIAGPLCSLACGGSGGGGASTTPTTPSPSTPAPTNTTVNIVSSAGSGAFNPNPVQVPSGGAIVWRNATGDAHVLVMNNGAPLATVAPGASVTTTISGSGGNFRCTTHPSMVGSINGTTTQQPPTTGEGY